LFWLKTEDMTIQICPVENEGYRVYSWAHMYPCGNLIFFEQTLTNYQHACEFSWKKNTWCINFVFSTEAYWHVFWSWKFAHMFRIHQWSSVKKFRFLKLMYYFSFYYSRGCVWTRERKLNVPGLFCISCPRIGTILSWRLWWVSNMQYWLIPLFKIRRLARAFCWKRLLV